MAGARRITLWVVLKSHQLHCQCRRWLQENYESQEVPADPSTKRKETVIRNPRQIAMLGSDHGINPSLFKRLQRERQCSKELLKALSLACRM